MKTLLGFLVLIQSCGVGNLFEPEIGTPDQNNYVSVTQALVCVGNDSSCDSLNAFYKAMRMFSPIQIAYASLSPTATVSYTSSISGTMSLASFLPVNDTDNSLPSFGTVGISSFDSNDLRKCGVGGNQRCTQAIIRAYLSSTSSNFVDGGAVAKIGSSELGVGVLNSVTLLTGNISGRNRIRTSPAGQNPFSGAESNVGTLVLDLTNANFGTYSATIVIELAIGPM